MISAWLYLWLIILLAPRASAQKRGPITIYLVNDSDEPLTAVWLNQLRVVNDQLIPATTGPIPPGAIEKYKSYPFDGIELHRAQDECAANPQGECQSAHVQVRKASGEYPTSKFSSVYLSGVFY